MDMDRVSLSKDFLDAPHTPHLSRSLIAHLADDLRSAGWAGEKIEELCGERAHAALSRGVLIPARLKLRSIVDSFEAVGGHSISSSEYEDAVPMSEITYLSYRCSLLTLFFMLGEKLTENQISQAFPSLGARGLLSLRLAVKRSDGFFEAEFDVRPHAAVIPINEIDGSITPIERMWWVLSDISEDVAGDALADDYVLGIGGATLSLLHMTVRKRVERGLDLGCGCGVQALYMAEHVTHVVATDISMRACAITAFNALLNNVEIDVRCGSFFEPVEGEKFDLIATNPPFVITASKVRDIISYEYRDGGRSRDELGGEIIALIPTFLSEDGYAHMLANWEITNNWQAHPRQWLEGCPLDAWVVQRDSLDAAQYVEMWLRDSGQSIDDALYSLWLDDFDSAGVNMIGMGMINLHAQAEPVAERIYEIHSQGFAPSGQDVMTMMNNLRVSVGAEQSLAHRHLRLASDVYEERIYTPGQSDPRSISLVQSGHTGRKMPLSTLQAAFFGACDGELSAAQIASALASYFEAEESDVWKELLPALVNALRWGILS